MIAILCYVVRDGMTEEEAFKHKLEVGKGRGRLVLEKDYSGQKEEKVQNTEVGDMFKEQKGGHCGWMEGREGQSRDEDLSCGASRPLRAMGFYSE